MIHKAKASKRLSAGATTSDSSSWNDRRLLELDARSLARSAAYLLIRVQLALLFFQLSLLVLVVLVPQRSSVQDPESGHQKKPRKCQRAPSTSSTPSARTPKRTCACSWTSHRDRSYLQIDLVRSSNQRLACAVGYSSCLLIQFQVRELQSVLDQKLQPAEVPNHELSEDCHILCR